MSDDEHTKWGRNVGDVELDDRQTADEMDERRREQIAYEYLCHLEEARLWLESCIQEELPTTTELEESFRNGVTFAKLANFFAPKVAPLRKIFDKDLSRYNSSGLHFRHTDNLMYLIRAMEKIGLPKVFYPETTDIYDMKNMPRAIYCIHALSLFLFKLGIAPQIQDLYGKAEFTEEEINIMKQALDQYGIQMPAFGKIGGILASELSDNEAALHAAVVAINTAIDNQIATETLKSLQNPASRLLVVNPDYSDEYQELLHTSKDMKCQQAMLKGKSEEELDMYDKLLTHAEIQGHVKKVNLTLVMQRINQAIDQRNEEALIDALLSEEVSLADVHHDNSAWYMQNMLDEKQSKKDQQDDPDVYVALDYKDVQNCVLAANNLADRVSKMEGIVRHINKMIDSGAVDELIIWLQKPEGLLPAVDPSRPNLYMDNLRKAKSEKCADLTHDDLTENLKVLTALARINQAIDTGNEDRLSEALDNPEAKLNYVDESLGNRYLSHFVAVKKEKRDEVGHDHEDLNRVEVQALIEYVNAEVQDENNLLSAISRVNEAIDIGDPAALLICLELPAGKLTNVRSKNYELYSIVLKQSKLEKAQRMGDEAAELWHEEIQECIDKGNHIADDAEQLASGIIAINETIEMGDSGDLMVKLKSKAVALRSITPECATSYQAELKTSKAKKYDPAWDGWTEHKLYPVGYVYYLNYYTKESRWSEPPHFHSEIGFLNREEIQNIISKVTSNYDRDLFLTANEPSAVKIQANWKGHKIRKEYIERKHFVQNQMPAIIKIQAWWRGIMARRKYKATLARLHGDIDSVIKIQSIVRMWLAKKAYQQRQKYFRDHIKEIIQMQSFVRANLAHNDYKQLSKTNPPVKSVRKFLHLLENDHIDFSEELELQKLKAQVVTDIRSLAQLESDLNLMDIKIGLLVRNRITLQDVVIHGKKLKREKENSVTASQNTAGIKALSREKREMLEGYQHLFYLLQTNPTYLAKLIFQMQQSKTTKFMESVILTLYNYASNSREEYLLLKLFETALREEIMHKIDQIVEIVTGNPTVVKMVVHFNRGAKGQSSLRDILAPLVREVLNDKALNINTSPVEVYKLWVNQLETETGKASGMPYDVDNDYAMKQPEVAKRVNASIKSLELAADKFLTFFIKSIDLIPYGMRYVAMTLGQCLSEKFGKAADSDEILKVVGNLIYYRYMNPAIVAPDAFDIVDVALDKGMTVEQRRNLGSIAKVLQYATSNKMFDRENNHLSPLNPYITIAFDKFKQFFLAASTVEDAETHFNIDQYSDVTMLAKPVVYMTVQEIIDTHQLLAEHLDEITTDRDDALRELLDDIGDIPKLEDIVGTPHKSEKEKDKGIDAVEDQEQQLAKLARTEVSLTLTNKFEVPDDDDSDMKALFVRTKKLIVEVMRVQQGESLVQILDTPATKEQELEHQRNVKQRSEQEKREKSAKVSRSHSIGTGDSKLPLKDLKKKIWKNLKTLQGQNLVSSKNDYQDIANAIAKDIRNQRRYRQRRKEELQKLKQTLENLTRKSKFYEEQVDYYNQYIKVCLDNLVKKKTGKPKKGKKAQEVELINKGAIRYSAQKLFEKGVILEIEGLPSTQFKNVQFEIKSGEDVGVFEVSAKFMGVAMERVELIFQDLLQLQYDGVAVMKMFGKAKINVNLLVFLLNKKFYGK